MPRTSQGRGVLPYDLDKTSALECYARALEFRQFHSSSETVNRQCPLGAPKIKIVGAKNLEVSKLVPQAQLVVRVQLVAVAGATDTLKVFAAVWIANF
jgi:hypothetical protein